MEYSAYFHEMQPAVANGLEDYLFEALVESRSKLYSGNPPSSSKIDAILRERAGEHATLVRQTIPGPHTHGGPFEFAVHDGVFDYSQSFDPDERLEDEVIRSNIYLQVRPQEYIYSLTTAADEAREIPATLSATIGLTSEDTVVRMVPAPYWQTYYKSVSFLAHSFENQPRIWNVTSDSSSSTIVAVADVSSPQGPWPDIARPPLCLVSGRFEAVLDARHGGLVRYTVTNARGQVVEQLKASDFVEANGSAAPLGVEHRTYWPSESAQLRSVTSFSGTFSETDGEPRPRSILIRPGLEGHRQTRRPRDRVRRGTDPRRRSADRVDRRRGSGGTRFAPDARTSGFRRERFRSPFRERQLAAGCRNGRSPGH